MALSTASSITIADIPKHRLPDAVRLSQRAFGFTDADLTPPVILRLQQEYGGCMLGAFDADEIVGFVPAFACIHGGARILYSAGLSVDSARQSGGIGAALMEAMGNFGRAHGYKLIKWTTNVMDSRNLHLYLNKVTATIIDYRPGIYVGLSSNASEEGFDGDDVEFDWHLDEPLQRLESEPHDLATAEAHAVTRTRENANGERELMGTAEPGGGDALTVEIPWDGRRLEALDRTAVTTWRRSLAALLPGLFGAGYVGTRLVLDKRQRRSFVVFRRPVTGQGH